MPVFLSEAGTPDELTHWPETLILTTLGSLNRHFRQDLEVYKSWSLQDHRVSFFLINYGNSAGSKIKITRFVFCPTSSLTQTRKRNKASLGIDISSSQTRKFGSCTAFRWFHLLSFKGEQNLKQSWLLAFWNETQTHKRFRRTFFNTSTHSSTSNRNRINRQFSFSFIIVCKPLNLLSGKRGL